MCCSLPSRSFIHCHIVHTLHQHVHSMGPWPWLLLFALSMFEFWGRWRRFGGEIEREAPFFLCTKNVLLTTLMYPVSFTFYANRHAICSRCLSCCRILLGDTPHVQLRRGQSSVFYRGAMWNLKGDVLKFSMWVNFKRISGSGPLKIWSKMFWWWSHLLSTSQLQDKSGRCRYKNKKWAN